MVSSFETEAVCLPFLLMESTHRAKALPASLQTIVVLVNNS